MSIKSNRQPAMSSSSQGIRLCRLFFQHWVASSPPRAAPPDGCVSTGDPVIPAARCRALERSPRETGNPHRARRKPGARYVHEAQERFAECLGLKIPLYCGVFPAFFGLVWVFIFFRRRMNERALWGREGGNLTFLARFFVVEYLEKKKRKIFLPCRRKKKSCH